MATEQRSRATLRRSVRLLSAFRLEQSDPDFFYGQLAEDTVEQISEHLDLDGALALDLGTGAGYNTLALRKAGARCFGLEYDPGELTWRSDTPIDGVAMGSGMQLPFRGQAFDLTFSSNVLEHVPDPWRLADEMVRVTRPGGLVYLSYTNWLSPWGGHETAPWHYLGGRRAADRYAAKSGKRPKNDFGVSLFAVGVGDALAWAQRQPDAGVVAAFPRYHPRWARWVVRVPAMRELVTWNLVLLLRRR